MSFSKGDKVKYAAHPVSWQADGSWVPATLTAKEAKAHGLEPVAEDWRAAKVLDVIEHPIPIDTPDAEADTVLVLKPDGYEPPLHLNAKLVRHR